MELALNSNFIYLEKEELQNIDGGKTDWFGYVLGGAFIVGAVIGLVAAPQITAPVLFTYYSSLAGGLYQMSQSTNK